MVRIWLNHWFSTAYNIINLIKADEKDFYIIGTNDNEYAVYKTVCDEWYVEPVLKDEEYVEYCLSFCKEHSVDIFMPRRGMLAISNNKFRFENIGVKVMVDDFEIVNILNPKKLIYTKMKMQSLFISKQELTTVSKIKHSYLNSQTAKSH